ncbi:MAG: ABC transporter ATP-binding protein [Oscillospiraceae bacterium]|jgi:ABC-2 type transport system ATP-binding protein|nr:ABC transporter ATP-binding protein [Oscillospiraceae bacterium]
MIKLEKAVKTFGGFTALSGVDLEIPRSCAYGLIGSNGAGKSTVLRILSGIYDIDSGEATIDGEIVFDNPKIKEKIFFVNDETVQWNNYTLSEMRDYFTVFYPGFSREKFEKMRSSLGLPTEKRLATFSKGMKRQAFVICGISCSPEFLYLDEAFDGLDPAVRIIVKKMLVDCMLDSEMTVVISSHNLFEIDEFCDRAGLLHKGEIVFDRELDSLKGNVQKIQTAFDRNYEKEDFDDIEILHFERNRSVVYIIAKGESEDIKRKISAREPKILDMLPLSLEEIFIYELEVLGYDFRNSQN